ncbi:MAG: phosphoribosyltransferase family protein, partial [Armatimonadota bacterium]
RRAAEYVGGGEPPDLRGRRVYLVDDGLATGYTMITAAQMVRRRSPERLVLCVPVSPVGSIVAAEPYFDDVYCLIAQELPSFAVASFYARVPDLTDEEVRRILSRRRLR